MGKIINNAITGSFSGKFGDDLVFRRLGNRTIFARKGRNQKPSTVAQTNNRHRFAEAQIYTRQLLEQPDQSERYAVMAQLNGYYSAQIAAVKDYMCLPEIEGINIKKGKAGAGDVILIKPKIYLKIVRLDITLYNTDSTVLESGPAVKTGLNWKYNTTTPVEQLKGTRLEVVTYDRFNKSCTFVQVLS